MYCHSITEFSSEIEKILYYFVMNIFITNLKSEKIMNKVDVLLVLFLREGAGKARQGGKKIK